MKLVHLGSYKESNMQAQTVKKKMYILVNISSSIPEKKVSYMLYDIRQVPSLKLTLLSDFPPIQTKTFGLKEQAGMKEDSFITLDLTKLCFKCYYQRGDDLTSCLTKETRLSSFECILLIHLRNSVICCVLNSLFFQICRKVLFSI